MESEKYKDAILKKAALYHRLQNRLKLVFDSWPNLRRATFKLMDFVHTDVCAKDGTPLLSKCLLAAVEAYEACPPQKVGKTTQMFFYLNGLLQHAHEIVNCHVVDDGTPPKSWEPFNQSILEFLEQNKNTTIHNEQYAKVDPNSIRLMLLARIITIKDLHTIESSKHLTEFFEDADLITH